MLLLYVLEPPRLQNLCHYFLLFELDLLDTLKSFLTL